MAGYEGRPRAKLGMTRDQLKGALHSPEEENALVLYVPPEEFLNIQPTLVTSKEKKDILVHGKWSTSFLSSLRCFFFSFSLHILGPRETKPK